MDTGGFKGRSREVARDELYGLYRDVFGLQQQYLVNEYGMTELGSQFYDATLVTTRTAGGRPCASWRRRGAASRSWPRKRLHRRSPVNPASSGFST